MCGHLCNATNRSLNIDSDCVEWINFGMIPSLSRIYQIHHYSCKLERAYDSRRYKVLQDFTSPKLVPSASFGPMMLIPTLPGFYHFLRPQVSQQCGRWVVGPLYVFWVMRSQLRATEGQMHFLDFRLFWIHNPPDMYVLCMPPIC